MTALSESFCLTSIHNIFSWLILTFLLFIQIGKPVLDTHFNPDNPIVVETDASDYVIAAIISQISPNNGYIHPITFYSHSMQPAELNYEIYDKELLAIFDLLTMAQLPGRLNTHCTHAL